MSVTADRQATYGEVLANSTFRVLFASRSLAISADTLRIVALSVLVYGITGSPLLAAVTYGIGFLPQVIGSSLLGALADRLPPRGLIVAGYAVECGSALLLSLAGLPVWGSLLLVGAIACLTPVFGAASSRLIADRMAGDTYVLARSLSSMAGSAAQLAGLAIGGIAVGALGARHALLVCACCHLISALIVYIGLGRTDAPTRTTKSVFGQSWNGNIALLRDRHIRRLMIAQWLPPMFVTGAEALVIPYASQRGFPAGSAGFLLACLPVGMLAGNLVVGRFPRPATRERLVPPLIALCGGPLLGLAFGLPLLAIGALLAATGCGFAFSLGLQRRFRDAVDVSMRGQAFGLLTTGLMTLQGIGPGLFGTLAQLLPTGTAMSVAGLASLATAWWAWMTLRTK